METKGHAIIDGRCYLVCYDPDFAEVEISDHAIDRYIQYNPPPLRKKPLTEQEERQNAKVKLIRLIAKSRPAQLKPKYRGFQMARHGADAVTSYRFAKRYVLVFVDQELRTIHQNEAERWMEAEMPC